MSSCTPFINRTITEEISLFRGESTRLKGTRIQISFLACHSVFSTINIPPRMQHAQIWHFSGLICLIRDYVNFLGINPHNSNSDNWCMKRCTRTIWKTMLVVFSKFSWLLQGMGRDFKGMCGNSQPQTHHLLGYQL